MFFLLPGTVMANSVIVNKFSKFILLASCKNGIEEPKIVGAIRTTAIMGGLVEKLMVG